MEATGGDGFLAMGATEWTTIFKSPFPDGLVPMEPVDAAGAGMPDLVNATGNVVAEKGAQTLGNGALKLAGSGGGALVAQVSKMFGGAGWQGALLSTAVNLLWGAFADSFETEADVAAHEGRKRGIENAELARKLVKASIEPAQAHERVRASLVDACSDRCERASAVGLSSDHIAGIVSSCARARRLLGVGRSRR